MKTPDPADRPRYPWETDTTEVEFSTPEQVNVTFRVASIGLRVLAALLDNLLILAILVLLFIAAIVIAVSLGVGDRAVAFVFIGFILLRFVLQTFYFVWAELRHDGQTLGKRYLRIRTVMQSGHGLTFSASLLRNLMRIVDTQAFLWLVMFFNRRHCRLGDYLAGTFVINEAESQETSSVTALAPSYRELQDRRFVIGAGAATRLFAEDLNLLEHLFGRARLVPTRERKELLLKVALKYVERLEAQEQQQQIEAEPERFLRELHLYLRDRFEPEVY